MTKYTVSVTVASCSFVIKDRVGGGWGGNLLFQLDMSKCVYLSGRYQSDEAYKYQC